MIFTDINDDCLVQRDMDEELDKKFIQNNFNQLNFNPSNLKSSNSSFTPFSQTHNKIPQVSRLGFFDQCMQGFEQIHTSSMLFTAIVSKKANELFD